MGLLVDATGQNYGPSFSLINGLNINMGEKAKTERQLAHEICTRIIADAEDYMCVDPKRVGECMQYIIDLREQLIKLAESLSEGTYDAGLYKSCINMKKAMGRVTRYYRLPVTHEKISKGLVGQGGKNCVEIAQRYVAGINEMRADLAQEIRLLADREGLNLPFDDLDDLKAPAEIILE